MHAFDPAIIFDKCFRIWTSFNRNFFGHRAAEGLFKLNTDMPRKAEHFVANRLLESIYKRKRNDPYGHAYDGGGYRKPDNKPGK